MTTAADINSTDFPRDKRLAELEAKLSGEYIGGMTEYWQRSKDFLLSEEAYDVLDGPEQECYPVAGTIQSFITNPLHGGKVTCYKCHGFVTEGDAVPYLDHQHPKDFPKAHFHKDCYNPYEHYYGLDIGID